MTTSHTDTQLVLTGLHHVTAVTGRASENVWFYTQVLGLRLVKKTVNQDDVSAYHLFYADRIGSPGTDVTFFDWPKLPPHRPGAGDISLIALRVPGEDALAYWRERLANVGRSVEERESLDGRRLLAFTDPEGQRLALVDDQGAPGGGIPWEHSPVPPEVAIRGLAFVTLTVRQLTRTQHVLEELLGFRRTLHRQDNGIEQVLFETGPGGPGAQVVVEVHPGLPLAHLGTGGVHHVAFRTPDDATHRRWRERIAAAGFSVTPQIDRFYFRSLYFREPGGILFEIATDGPGFATDEDPEHLGERLSLPPFLEPYRAQIEANLRPIDITVR